MSNNNIYNAFGQFFEKIEKNTIKDKKNVNKEFAKKYVKNAINSISSSNNFNITTSQQKKIEYVMRELEEILKKLNNETNIENPKEEVFRLLEFLYSNTNLNKVINKIPEKKEINKEINDKSELLRLQKELENKKRNLSTKNNNLKQLKTKILELTSESNKLTSEKKNEINKLSKIISNIKNKFNNQNNNTLLSKINNFKKRERKY